MNILMAASELAPFAQTGDWGESLLALSRELAGLGHEVSVAIPYYRQIRENKKWKARSISARLTIAMGNQRRFADVLETRAPNGVQVFLIRRDEYFDRSGLYGTNGADYEDNSERFIFFTKCVLDLAKRMEPAPQVLHAHDWQTALLPIFVKAQQAPFGTALTIRDLAHQGNFWSYDFALTNLSAEWFSTKGAEFYGSMNCIKGGVVQADAVLVPSAPYAHAIQTPEYGCGLDAVFRENAWKLHGVPVEREGCSPASDPDLPKTFDGKHPDGKRACREALLKRLALSPSPSGPVLLLDVRESAAVSLLLPLLDRLLAEDVRLVLTGQPEKRFQAELKTHLLNHRQKMATETHPDNLPYAGADILLLPTPLVDSRHAITALKYGAIPLAQACGGLNQIVQDYNPSTGEGTGFVFYDSTSEALLDGFRRANRIFIDPPSWRPILQSAMGVNFSKTAAAKAHAAVYQGIAKPALAAMH